MRARKERKNILTFKTKEMELTVRRPDSSGDAEETTPVAVKERKGGGVI